MPTGDSSNCTSCICDEYLDGLIIPTETISLYPESSLIHDDLERSSLEIEIANKVVLIPYGCYNYVHVALEQLLSIQSAPSRTLHLNLLFINLVSRHTKLKMSPYYDSDGKEERWKPNKQTNV